MVDSKIVLEDGPSRIYSYGTANIYSKYSQECRVLPRRTTGKRYVALVLDSRYLATGTKIRLTSILVVPIQRSVSAYVEKKLGRCQSSVLPTTQQLTREVERDFDFGPAHQYLWTAASTFVIIGSAC
jgi:hypothetical protein